MRNLDYELGMQVMVSTAVAISTRCRISVERDIAEFQSRISELSGPGSEAVKQASMEHANRIRQSMEQVAEDLVGLLTDLRKEWARVESPSEPGKAVKRRGRPRKNG